MEKHLPNILVGIWAILLCAALLFLSRLVRPESRNELSRIAFDSGERPEGKPWVRTTARYHLLLAGAVLFMVVMHVLYPAAAAFHSWIEMNKGLPALVEVGVFLAVLGVALAYSWKKGDLDWKSGAGEAAVDNATNQSEVGLNGDS